jgi:PAS domain S-box-containing protein
MMKIFDSFLDAIIKRADEGICACHAILDYPYVQFTVWNDRTVDITGYTVEQINRLGYYQTLGGNPDIQARGVESIFRMYRGGGTISEEWEITRADGQRRLLSLSTSVLDSRDGLAHLLSFVYDITERKEVEERITHLASFPQLNPNPIVETDLSGHIRYLNPACERLFPDLLSAGVEHPWLRDFDSLVAMFRDGKISSHARDISVEDSWYHQTIYYPPARNRIRIYGFDTTEQKRMEEALRESEKRYRNLVAQSLQGTFVVQDMRIVFCNRTFANMGGYTPEELYSFSPEEVDSIQMSS